MNPDQTESDNKPFPIQSGRYKESSIPWWLAKIAYDWYSEKYGTSQPWSDWQNAVVSVVKN
jgi:hypothetical protein